MALIRGTTIGAGSGTLVPAAPPPPPPAPPPVAPVGPSSVPLSQRPAPVQVPVETGAPPVGSVSQQETHAGIPAGQGLAPAPQPAPQPQPEPAPPPTLVPTGVTPAPSLAELTGPQLDAWTVLSGQAFVASLQAACDAFEVDPEAAASVSEFEGISGGIGDGGTSYGPWQMHAGGALPASYSSLPPYSATVQAWAWSAAGIWYAVAAMSQAGARGLAGHAAIHAIVYSFERPADPADEAANATDYYDTANANPAGFWSVFLADAGGPSQTPQNPSVATGKTPPTPTSIEGPWEDLLTVFRSNVPKAKQRMIDSKGHLTGVIG